MPLKAPKWSTNLVHDRTELKAARMMALYLNLDRLGDMQKKEIAAALGISRWTLDKDLASLGRVREHVAAFDKILSGEQAATSSVATALAVLQAAEYELWVDAHGPTAFRLSIHAPALSLSEMVRETTDGRADRMIVEMISEFLVSLREED